MSSEGSIVSAKETFQIIREISKILNTGLDETSLAICVRLCENNVNPEALAKIVTELKRVKREELSSNSRSDM
ncbi:UNVERIFIED_CONTAM: hypothetical protein RMT77_012466 [Armadillidium vulgare]|uniref:Mitotic-spindle organizing protein 1 n=1 Tax=Armadillidium nasatum TaxID=96803 RepID=A0A5N5TPU5_9CRUS|nr:Mitotic-spindle organizing protein 1 [Armadillidium nasatum]